MLYGAGIAGSLFLTIGWVTTGLAEQAALDRLPAQIVFLDPGASPFHVLLVDKSIQELLVYTGGAGGITLVGRYACSTGKIPGPKQRSGDQKTPEGIYFFVKRHLKKDLAPIYGDMAFPLDYPNQFDRLVGRGGYAIWLHGTNKPLKARDSNGCIVVENSTINILAKMIRLHRTPIILADKLAYSGTGSRRSDLEDARNLVKRWCRYLARGSYSQYRNLYAANRAPGMRWWSRWCDLRKIPGDGHMQVEITTNELAVYRQADLFCITFNQVVGSHGKRLTVGRKKLFARRQSGKLKIITESYLGKAGVRHAGSDRLFAAIKEIGDE